MKELKNGILTVALAFASILMATRLPTLNASEPLRESLSDVAVQVRKVLELENAESVAIGLFTPANAEGIASYGRRIAEFLRLELEHQMVSVPQKANLRIKGEYLLDSDTGTISISLDIVDSKGNTVSSIATGAINAKLLETEVRDSAEIILVSSTSMAVTPSQNREVERVVEKLKQPESEDLKVDDGFLILSGLGLGIRLREIDRGETGKVVNAISSTPPHFRLKQDRSYAIELKSFRNDIDFNNKVLFDGIDTFVLSEDEARRIDPRTARRIPVYEYWALQRSTSQFIPGWFRNLREVNAFQIVPDEKSVAHRLGAPQGIGTIQVVASAAWPVGATVDPKFRKPFLPGANAKGGAGAGALINVNLKPVQMETGVLLGAITAQYEVE